MSDPGWWQRKLAATRQAPQAAPPRPYPTQNLPAGYQAPPQQYPQEPPPEQDPSQIRVTTHNLFQAAALWKGGPAHRTDTQPCPSCGGNQFFSRSTGMSRLPPPAPHCYNCGYNGLFAQGEQSAWEAASG